MTVNELALQVVEAMRKKGHKERTIWSEYSSTFISIIQLHEQRGAKDFNQEIIHDYLQNLENRVECGEIKPGYYRKLRRSANRLSEFYNTGRLDWSCPGKVSKFVLNDYYDNILSEYLADVELHHNTKGDVIWVSKKYFAWLILEGHNDLCNVGVDEIVRFLYHCYQHMRSNSIHNIKLYMKKLYRFLVKSGYSSQTYELLLSFKVSRESKMFPAASPDDVKAVLESVDRRTLKGKRDYAIILLGVITGLRGVDVANLKLSDIDWKKGEIKIIQEKTGESLVLPLIKDVGVALKDYILNGRPESEAETIFIRDRAPFQGFASGFTIGNIYDYYCKRAGVERSAFDGKGFHSLRRAVGKNMIISGIPVTTVAQVLGQSYVNSTKKYIPLDSHHLKECALDFSGIERGAEHE